MFIQTEETPNPATLKFLPGQPVTSSGTAEFINIDETARSPLAKRLFEVGNVSRVFFGPDFISVTKTDDAEWETLKTHVLGEIMQHYTSGLPVMEPIEEDEGSEVDEDDDEIVVQIKEILDTRVRPAVAQDGGDIVFKRFENGIVFLQMQGACAGCPSSTATLKMGIENMLKHFVPEVIAVEQDQSGFSF